ncbi:MAG TPA: DUF1854 domain-containing protein [Longimicrobiales bacterium]|nr:DUF1854 domain-containing protein [Longimicrobiales bacterium]
MEGIAGGFSGALSGLQRRNGRLFLERPGDDAVEVTVRYLRPLTARTELVFLDPKGQEVATLPGLDALPEAERPLVEEALRQRYILSAILRVDRIDVRFGTRYWWVDTDRGPRWFALREPGRNVTWISGSHLILRDTAGNRFEIRDLTSLDRRSQRWIARSL